MQMSHTEEKCEHHWDGSNAQDANTQLFSF